MGDLAVCIHDVHPFSVASAEFDGGLRLFETCALPHCLFFQLVC